jgi:hypothetical protein
VAGDGGSSGEAYPLPRFSGAGQRVSALVLDQLY